MIKKILESISATLLIAFVAMSPQEAKAVSNDTLANADIRLMNYEHRIDNERAKQNKPIKERMAVQSLPQKISSASSQSGRISITSLDSDDPNTPFMQALVTAANIWEKYLRNTKSIRIAVKREPMPSDIMVDSYVSYINWYKSIEPYALCHQSSLLVTPMPLYDAELVFNSSLSWYYGTETANTSGISVVTAMLRCIAQTLGMGSTIVYDEYGISLEKPDQKFTYLYGDSLPGPMERLIFNPSTNVRLKDLNVAGDAFANFVQPSTEKGLYCCKNSYAYQLYSPQEFEESRSLAFFQNPNSLMYFNFQPGDRHFVIDEATLETLAAIGWESFLDLHPVITDVRINLIGTGMGRNFSCALSGERVSDITVYGINGHGEETKLNSMSRGYYVILNDVPYSITALKFIASNAHGLSEPKTVSIPTTSVIPNDCADSERTFMIFDQESNLIATGGVDEYSKIYSSLNAGYYFVRYYNEEGFSHTEQIYKPY